jgi:hypothetical protein
VTADPVFSAMQQAQWLNADFFGLDPVPVELVPNVLREVILGPKPENSEAPAVSLEAEQRKPVNLEAMPTLDPSFVWPDSEEGGPLTRTIPSLRPPPLRNGRLLPTSHRFGCGAG